MNTGIDSFYRTTNALRGAQAGIERWRYDGPTPERLFCKDIFQKVFTTDEISEMDNGQIGDVFYYGGGYNCRHFWTPVQ